MNRQKSELKLVIFQRFLSRKNSVVVYLEDGVDGRCLIDQNLEAEGDAIGVVGSDGLSRQSGLAEVKDRGEDEHGLGCEAIHLSGGVLRLGVLQGQVVPKSQLGDGGGQRGPHEEVAVHQILPEWRTFLEKSL